MLVTCPGCQKPSDFSEEAIGTRVRCPGCRQPFVVQPNLLVVCPGCRKTAFLPNHAAGKRAKCPACKIVFIVPEPILTATLVEEALPPSDEDDPPPRPKRRPKPKPRAKLSDLGKVRIFCPRCRNSLGMRRIGLLPIRCTCCSCLFSLLLPGKQPTDDGDEATTAETDADDEVDTDYPDDDDDDDDNDDDNSSGGDWSSGDDDSGDSGGYDGGDSGGGGDD